MNLRFLFTLLLFACASLCLDAQITITPALLDFGTTQPETQWVVDVKIKNQGEKKDFLLRTTFSHEYEVLYTSKTLMPDSTITMRVKFMPRLKGVFDEKIEIYFASMDKPIVFPVRAIVEYKNPQDNIPCPDFSRLAADCCSDNMFVVQVKDEQSGLPISGVSVIISESGHERMKILTGKNGIVTQSIPIGYYEIRVIHPDFEVDSKVGYINHRNSRFEFLLKPNSKPIPVKEEEEVKKEMVETPVDTMVKYDLPLDEFKPNNIVFLLDVSHSMAQGEKLKLMKGALHNLSGVLRPIDKITIVSYADNAEVLLQTTSGAEGQIISDLIEAIKVGGSTSGEKGFKTAYRIMRREFLKDSNNQLIVVTDGVFQPADQIEIDKLVKKNSKKQITTSVVGIQCASFAELKLTEISSAGHGSFLLIESENDMHVITEEMKRRSAK
jgi:Ca-activated chloride channel homolog